MREVLILLLVGLAVSLFFWAGANTTFDDANYLLYANQMLNGTYNLTQSPYAYGSGFISTIAVSYQAFGMQSWAASLPQIVEYIALAIVSYLLCLRYFDKKVALASALCLELSPFVFAYSTRVLPDMLLGLLMALALLIIAYTVDGKREDWMIAAGMFCGAGIFVKFGGIAFAAIVVLGLLIVYKSIYKPLYFIAGFALVLFLYAFQLPMPASILSMMSTYSAQQSSLSQASLYNNFVIMFILLAGYKFGTIYLNQIFPLGGLFIFTIIGSMLLFRSDNRDMKFYALLFWASFLYLIFGTENITSWTFISVVSRYFILLAPVMAVLTGYAFTKLYKLFSENKKTMFMVSEILLVVFLLSNLPMYLYFHQYPNLPYNRK